MFPPLPPVIIPRRKSNTSFDLTFEKKPLQPIPESVWDHLLVVEQTDWPHARLYDEMVFPWFVPSRPIPHTQPDDPRLSCLGLPLSLPYQVETLAEMDDRLDLICCRLVECTKAREFGQGFRMWDSSLTVWLSMGYPMKKEIKIKLIFLYWEIMCRFRMRGGR